MSPLYKADGYLPQHDVMAIISSNNSDVSVIICGEACFVVLLFIYLFIYLFMSFMAKLDLIENL